MERRQNGVDLARGVCRALEARGYASLTEFKLRTGRRVDVIGIDPGGLIAIVEVKASVEDFRADRKWPQYVDFCDHFFFAVPEGFPRDLVPEDCGLLIADAYGAALVRAAPLRPLGAGRRRAQILRFAHTAAQRLARHEAPLAEAYGFGAQARQGRNIGTRRR